MAKDSGARRIAVVGIGPRGLGALEALAARSDAEHLRVSVEVFDPTACPGAGPNFDPAQNPLCLLNIPVRGIEIGVPGYPGAPAGDFAEQFSHLAGDDFPPRAVLGTYLAARYSALAESAHIDLSVCPEHVRRIERAEAGWWLRGQTARFGPFDEVLLTQGQPSTGPDPQLARWTEHARSHGLDLVSAYPDDRLLAAARGWTGRPVAVRGLGLSTLDVLRLLTRGLGGRFAGGQYLPSGKEPSRILPFSLDGRPPAPKPATAMLDARYDPEPDETLRFERALAATMDGSPESDLGRIRAAVIPAATRIWKSAGGSGDEAAVVAWLETERRNPGGQDGRTAIESLKGDLAMALGREAPSVGYVVGQLWRKWQNELRRGYNPVQPDPATAAALVGFDEGLKRYSYGPPVSGAQEMLILVEDGLVDLCAVADPDILLHPTGWHLVEDDATARAVAMVDAVLPGPDLGRVMDPLMAGLRDEGMVVPVAEGLGVQTLSDGRVVGRCGDGLPGLALLGRMALGSVIAVDSIHDCFGAAADRWAQGAVGRLMTKA